jgi:hypothetical protein
VMLHFRGTCWFPPYSSLLAACFLLLYCVSYFLTLKVEVACSSEMSDLQGISSQYYKYCVICLVIFKISYYIFLNPLCRKQDLYCHSVTNEDLRIFTKTRAKLYILISTDSVTSRHLFVLVTITSSHSSHIWVLNFVMCTIVFSFCLPVILVP